MAPSQFLKPLSDSKKRKRDYQQGRTGPPLQWRREAAGGRRATQRGLLRFSRDFDIYKTTFRALQLWVKDTPLPGGKCKIKSPIDTSAGRCQSDSFFSGPMTFIGRLQKLAGGLIEFEGLRLPGVIGGLSFHDTYKGTPVAYNSKVGSFQGS